MNHCHPSIWAKTMLVVLTIAAAAAVSMGANSQASASEITWSTSVDETGRPSDVLTSGTLVAAVTAGRSSTVPGVKSVAQTSSNIASFINFGVAHSVDKERVFG
jgi:hypothetical protein